MIEHGLAHVIVSTGAIMAHGLSEAIGGVHYKHDPKVPDETALRVGLQPRLRHARDGGQPERGGADRRRSVLARVRLEPPDLLPAR